MGNFSSLACVLYTSSLLLLLVDRDGSQSVGRSFFLTTSVNLWWLLSAGGREGEVVDSCSRRHYQC